MTMDLGGGEPQRARLARLQKEFLCGQLPEQEGQMPSVVWCPNCTDGRGHVGRDPKTKIEVDCDTCGNRRMVRLGGADGRVEAL